jgi:hypothetical protein
MEEIRVRLWRNDVEQDWTVEINGKIYETMATDAIQALLKQSLNTARNSLAQGRSTHARDRSDLD